MRVIQRAQVIWLSRIRRADLSRLDLQLRLAQASPFDQDLICNATNVSPDRPPPCARPVSCDSHDGALSSASNGFRCLGSSRDAIAIDGTVCDRCWCFGLAVAIDEAFVRADDAIALYSRRQSACDQAEVIRVDQSTGRVESEVEQWKRWALMMLGHPEMLCRREEREETRVREVEVRNVERVRGGWPARQPYASHP